MLPRCEVAPAHPLNPRERSREVKCHDRELKQLIDQQKVCSEPEVDSNEERKTRLMFLLSFNVT